MKGEQKRGAPGTFQIVAGWWGHQPGWSPWAVPA